MGMGDSPEAARYRTRRSLENAWHSSRLPAAHTNAPLHIPALLTNGIRFELDDVARVLARTPLIADLKGPVAATWPAMRITQGARLSFSSPFSTEATCTGTVSPFRPEHYAEELGTIALRRMDRWYADAMRRWRPQVE